MSRVTILLSTFNGASFIDEQLQSIVQQTMSDWTLMVRDDGSFDQTIAIVERYAANDDRIVLLPIDGVNKGPAKSFLEMLRLVETPYFAFADQDDVWLPAKLANSLAAMAEIEITDMPCAVFGDAVLIRADGSVQAPSALGTRRGARPGRVTFGELLIQNVVMGGTLLGNRSLAERASLVDADLAPMHDWACALIARTSGSLVYRPTRDLLHRRHDANVTGASASSFSRLVASLEGGVSGWSRRLLTPAVAMARALADLPQLKERPETERLSRLDPITARTPEIRALVHSGAKPTPGWRRALFVAAFAKPGTLRPGVLGSCVWRRPAGRARRC